ncbi:hypothetical protein ACVWWR_007168 [Bradyrhizobium sp. LM3.2]
MNSNDNCVRGARGVDDGQPRKARTGRIDQALAPSVDLAERHSVNHDGHGQDAAGDLDRHGCAALATRPIDIDPRAVQRELDV